MTNADIAAYWREIRGEPSTPDTASPPPYPPALVIDCGSLIVTVYGQPSREDAEYMAAVMREMADRLNYEKP